MKSFEKSPVPTHSVVKQGILPLSYKISIFFAIFRQQISKIPRLFSAASRSAGVSIPIV